MIADINAGVKLDELVKRHYSRIYYGGCDKLTERLKLLRDKKIGVFARPKD